MSRRSCRGRLSSSGLPLPSGGRQSRGSSGSESSVQSDSTRGARRFWGPTDWSPRFFCNGKRTCESRRSSRMVDCLRVAVTAGWTAFFSPEAGFFIWSPRREDDLLAEGDGRLSLDEPTRSFFFRPADHLLGYPSCVTKVSPLLVIRLSAPMTEFLWSCRASAISAEPLSGFILR